MADRSGYIGRAPSDSSIIVARQTNQPTSTTSTFVFNSGYDVGYLDVYVNGAKLINATDYTATDTQNVSLTTAAVSGDVIEFVAYKAFNLANVVSSTPGNFTVDGSLSISDKIIHTGDTNTAIRFPAADTFTVETGGNESIRVDSSGRLLVGQTSAINGIFGSTPPRFSVSTTTASPSIFGTYSNNTYASRIDLVKSRSATVGSHTVVQAGDALGELYFGGSDGDQYQPAALIQSVVESGVGNNDMPADLRFFTNSGSTTVTERLRITSTGQTKVIGTDDQDNFIVDGNSTQFVIHQDSTDGEVSLRAQDGSGNNYTKYMTFFTEGGSGPTERLRILSDGKVRVPDNGKFTAGTGGDLQIFHDGNNSYIKEAGTGNIIHEVTDATIEFKKGGSEHIAKFIPDGAVELYHNNSKKFDTKSDGVDITGELQCDSLDVDGAADITGAVTLHNNLDLQDGDRIRLGTGDDLQIYHSGSNSFIDDTGTGQLALRSSEISFEKYTGEQLAKFTADASCQLYYNNSSKFQTTSSGANVNGELVCDGININGAYEQVRETVSGLAIDLSTGNYFQKTINGNSTFTFTNPPPSGTVGSFTLDLTHTSGTVTWPSSVKFPADTAPTLTAGKTHLFVFVTDDGGSRYRGAALADYVN